ncbi:Lrp/AsnC family transcriptional regulator [Pseudarthrobacter sp. N5]|uniref:Lrp/AsnC family transcriptional regulator n=1 Tax=Pseudarthrobacter sp. N5 TaxID=3418416 RepID=UPI003CF01836
MKIPDPLDSPVPDEVDAELVDALQINSRASWATVARVLDSSALTLSRRYQKLVESGLAWSTIALSPQSSLGAFIEVRCSPSQELAVARRLAERPDVITVGVTTGDFQVYCIILAPDTASIAHTLLHDLPLEEGVLRVRTNVFGSMFGGVVWRQGIISSRQTGVMKLVRDPLRTGIPHLSLDDRPLFLALGKDGRRSYEDLSAELGVSAYAIRRRISLLLRSGEITFRCDVARPLFGFPTSSLLLLDVPDAQVQTFGKIVGAWPETRFCAAVASASNVILIVGTRSLNHLEQLFIRLAADFPSVRINDRRLVLRPVKLYGRLVEEAGRAEGVIPVDPWYSQRN